MTVTHKWGVRGLDCQQDHETLNDVVLCIHWRLDSDDGVNEVSMQGSVGVPEPDSASFVPFNELTAAQVDAWLGGEIDKSAYEQAAESALAEKASPRVIHRALPAG